MASISAPTHQFPQNILLFSFIRTGLGLEFFILCACHAFAAAPVAETDPRVFSLENAKAKILLSLTKVGD